MWIYTIEPSLEIIQFEASETRGEYKVAYSEIIYVGFKLPKITRGQLWSKRSENELTIRSPNYNTFLVSNETWKGMTK